MELPSCLSLLVINHSLKKAKNKHNNTHTKWGLNARIGVIFGNVQLDWQNYKSHAENNGAATSESVSFSRDIVASQDDAVIFMSIDKEVWKYPIVDQDNNQLGTLVCIVTPPAA